MIPKHPENRLGYIGCIGALASSLLCGGLTAYFALPKGLNCDDPTQFGERGPTWTIGPLEAGCGEVLVGPGREQQITRFARLGPLSAGYNQTPDALVTDPHLRLVTPAGIFWAGIGQQGPYLELEIPEDPF